MGRPIVVAHDPVQGTDQHHVAGTGPQPAVLPPPTLPYTGTGTFTYTGSMTAGLSDLLTIGGIAVALVTSQSTLDPAETAPGGGHTGPRGTAFVASGAAPQPTSQTLVITDTPLGTGAPASGAGSALLTVGGTAVLLERRPVDTCGGHGTVTARGQSFVTRSGEEGVPVFPFTVGPAGTIALDPDDDAELRGRIVQVLFHLAGRAGQPPRLRLRSFRPGSRTPATRSWRPPPSSPSGRRSPAGSATS